MPDNPVQPKLDVASFATATGMMIDEYPQSTQERGSDLNFQLYDYLRAAERFLQLKEKANYAIEEATSILCDMCMSLSNLFGVSWEIPNGKPIRVPPLADFMDRKFDEVNWHLDAALKDQLRAMIKIYDARRHFHPKKVDQLLSLDLAALTVFMNSGRMIWIWFLEKSFGGSIPQGQIQYFKDEFS